MLRIIIITIEEETVLKDTILTVHFLTEILVILIGMNLKKQDQRLEKT